MTQPSAVQRVRDGRPLNATVEPPLKITCVDTVFFTVMGPPGLETVRIGDPGIAAATALNANGDTLTLVQEIPHLNEGHALRTCNCRVAALMGNRLRALAPSANPMLGRWYEVQSPSEAIRWYPSIANADRTLTPSTPVVVHLTGTSILENGAVLPLDDLRRSAFFRAVEDSLKHCVARAIRLN